MTVFELKKLLNMFENDCIIKLRNHHLEDVDIVEIKLKISAKGTNLILAERKL